MMFKKNKNTLTLAKKEIDAYIKENINFTPIWIETDYGGWRNEKQCIQLVAIRKDGRFVFENKKGEKEQLSEWDEKDYWIKSPYNIPIFKRINEIDNEIAILQAERRLEEGNLVKEDKGLKELKSRYIK